MAASSGFTPLNLIQEWSLASRGLSARGCLPDCTGVALECLERG